MSGAVALLLEQRPDLTPDQVKALLMTSAQALPAGDALAQGAGLLDIEAALARPTPNAHQTATSTGFAQTGFGGSWSGNHWS